MTDHSSPPATLTAVSPSSLSSRIASAEDKVRAQPMLGSHRWALFQLFCVTADWTRAVHQLQAFALIEREQGPAAQAYRNLIRAERWRENVLSGRERPGFVFDAPAWTDGLVDALRLAGSGMTEDADVVRRQALDDAPLVALVGNDRRLDWIADSDSRLGPVCELMTAGHYRWLPVSDIAAWRIARPASLLDLVWAPCTLTLFDASTVRGFMPARYPCDGDGEAGGTGGEPIDDSILLGTETSWHESGETGVIGRGRKTWATSAGDLSIFELDRCDFGGAATAKQPGHHHAT